MLTLAAHDGGRCQAGRDHRVSSSPPAGWTPGLRDSSRPRRAVALRLAGGRRRPKTWSAVGRRSRAAGRAADGCATGARAETRKDDERVGSLVVRVLAQRVKTSTATVGDFSFGVKFWWTKDDGVEASRPSHCAACGAAAHRGDGRLRLHGHGSRERTVWGPTEPSTAPAETSVRVRRYRCTDCGAARTVLPRGLGRWLRYSLSAIALALTAWAVWLRPAAAVRTQMSPLRTFGSDDAERWRSLPRWARRATALFDLPAGSQAAPRQQAARASQLVRARGPTSASEAARVVIGAHAG